MTTISIISGTDRPGSLSGKVADYVASKYREAGARPEKVSMADFPITKVAGGRYGEEIPEVEEFNAPLLASDGWVMIIPEYNGSFPGILKLFIDYLPYPGGMQNKPMSFIGEGNGSFGGLRAVEQMQMIAGYRYAYIFPERVFIPRVRSNFDVEEGIQESVTQDLLEQQVTGFVSFIRKLATSVPAG